ncbi:recombinase family protein [Flexivirga sp. B27]
MPSNAAQHCAIYTRRSASSAEGSDKRGRSQKQQEADCRDLAKRLGLDVVEVYQEKEGTGASDHSRKPRPVWKKALDDLDDGGRFHTLLVWSLDRAERRGAEHIAQLLKRHAGTGRKILGIDGTDTGDTSQRLGLIIRGEIAKEEADKLSERVSRARRYARAEGVWQSGAPPYGLRRRPDGKIEHDPETYAVARRIADDALAGLTPYRIAKALNDEGIAASRGTEWRTSSVRALLRAPGFAGLASIREKPEEGRAWAAIGSVYLDADDRPVSVGEGVITEAERAKILAATVGRTRVSADGTRRGARGAKVPTLLRGLLHCAVCGGRGSISGVFPGRSYVCANYKQGLRTCDGFSVPEPATDAAVADAFLRRLSLLDPEDEADAALLSAIAERWIARETPEHGTERQHLADAVVAREAALEGLLDLAETGILSGDRLKERVERARAAHDAAVAALDALPAPEADLAPLLDLVQSQEAWEAAGVDARRDYLSLAIDRVEATKAGYRGQRFFPGERLTVVWHDGTRTAAGAKGRVQRRTHATSPTTSRQPRGC